MPSSPAEVVQVVGAAIVEHGRCLVTQRGADVANAWEWEFPGGKIESDEGPREALEREIAEELGLQIDVGEWLGRGTHSADGRQIVLDVYLATIRAGFLRLSEHHRARWLGPWEIHGVDWSPADRPVLEALVRHLERPAGAGDRSEDVP